MSNEDIKNAILLLLGVAAVSEILKPKCSVCGRKVNHGDQQCKHCGAFLWWNP